MYNILHTAVEIIKAYCKKSCKHAQGLIISFLCLSPLSVYIVRTIGMNNAIWKITKLSYNVSLTGLSCVAVLGSAKIKFYDPRAINYPAMVHYLSLFRVQNHFLWEWQNHAKVAFVYEVVGVLVYNLYIYMHKIGILSEY